MLLKNYDGRDPRGLLISEKFDGVRGCWNGKALFTRSGNRIDCPAWFTAGLPPIALDGELWAGHGKFQIAKGLAQSGGRDAEWRCLQYVVFDAPGDGPFEFRQLFLRGEFPSHVTIALQVRCRCAAHLAAEFEAVQSYGGEGLVLRIPNSPYRFGERSSYWMKVKRNPALYFSAAAA